MAFIVEDGTVVALANSLVEVATADSFFADRRESRWKGTAADKQAALVRATDWFEQAHGLGLKGCRTISTQVLSFPRDSMYVHGFLVDDETVPAKVQEAICLYALRALERADIAPDPDLPGGKGSVTHDQIEVGPVTIVTKYSSPKDTPGDDTIPKMPEVELLLAPYLDSPSSSSGVSFGSAVRG